MKKVIAFSLIVLLTSPILIGCKGGSSCFTRNGSRVPTSCLNKSAYADQVDDATLTASQGSAVTGPRVVNAMEAPVMMANSAYSNCAPCAQTACNPCEPCSPCNPCNPCAPSGVSAMPNSSAGSYAGM